MKVLFSARPAYGHFYPVVPLALAFSELGHEVIFATGSEFLPLATKLGFEAVQCGPSVAWAEGKTIELHPELGNLPPDQKMSLGVTMFGETLAEAVAEELAPVLEQWRPDLVIFEATDLGAPLAARIAGIPSVHHSWGRVPGPFLKALIGPMAGHWEKAGLSVPSRFAGIEGDLYLDVCPPSLQDPAIHEIPNVRPMRSVAWAEEAALPESVMEHAERPLVYVTLGTVVFEAVGALNAALDGLEQLDVDVLVTVGPAGDPSCVGERPGRIQIERFVPQHLVLPHVDAVVSHCGSGTMLAACALGLPQLAIPQGADQFFNGEAIAAVGAGKMLRPEEITAESVRHSVQQLLFEDAFKMAAKKIAFEMSSSPPPHEVVSELIELASAS